jgi:para-nitrobenzyl esterase
MMDSFAPASGRPAAPPFLKTIALGAALAALAILAPAAPAAETPGRLVETAFGPVIGRASEGLAVFKGVPYAASPAGEGRFAPPEDPGPWTEAREAFEFGPICFQPLSAGNPFAPPPSDPVSEDCLSLNIWAPEEASPENPLPVYVFIHGGGFGLGAGSQALYDGSALAREGVVVVTLNYRLGALGFLAAAETLRLHGTTGNWGILDQIKALEWVKGNIRAFGGDPAKVTIGGESAGSVSVGLLVASPKARGLFRGAVMESGSAFSLNAYPLGYGDLAASIRQGAAFLSALRAGDDAQGLAKARAVEPGVLASLSPFNPDWTTVAAFSLFPVQDGAVIPLDPQKALASGDFGQVKLLIGFNADESTLFLENLQAGAPARAMIAAYLGPEVQRALWARHEPGSGAEEAALAVRAMAMGLFKAGAKRTADLHARHADVYMYRFEKVAGGARNNSLGAFHASELPLVFGNPASYLPESEIDQRLARDMRTRWVNFVKTGSPDEGSSSPTAVSWPKYDPSSPAVLRFGERVSAEPLPDADELDFLGGLLFGPSPAPE